MTEDPRFRTTDLYDQLRADGELDQLLEQELREEVCETQGHQVRLIAACRICGTAFHIMQEEGDFE